MPINIKNWQKVLIWIVYYKSKLNVGDVIQRGAKKEQLMGINHTAIFLKPKYSNFCKKKS